MTVINLFFNLPDEIKTIVWEFDPTYTIVKKDLCHYLRSLSTDFIHLCQVNVLTTVCED